MKTYLLLRLRDNSCTLSSLSSTEDEVEAKERKEEGRIVKKDDIGLDQRSTHSVFRP
jgi:hypothetical protein